MIQKSKPAYWAVLPAAVRYDPKLPSSAKLLYAELSALSNFSGYCMAGNQYFAEIYDMDTRTVQRLLKALSDGGYIQVLVDRDAITKAVTGRRIFCGINPLVASEPSASDAPPPDKNVVTSSDNFDTTPPDRNVAYNNILYNIPPIVPLKGEQPKRQRKELEHWKEERFEGFWEFYPRKTNKVAAQRAWDRLKPSDELIAEIGTKLTILKSSPGWQEKKYIPHASTFLNQRRWNDVEDLMQPAATGWAIDPEVI